MQIPSFPAVSWFLPPYIKSAGLMPGAVRGVWGQTRLRVSMVLLYTPACVIARGKGKLSHFFNTPACALSGVRSLFSLWMIGGRPGRDRVGRASGRRWWSAVCPAVQRGPLSGCRR